MQNAENILKRRLERYESLPENTPKFIKHFILRYHVIGYMHNSKIFDFDTVEYVANKMANIAWNTIETNKFNNESSLLNEQEHITKTMTHNMLNGFFAHNDTKVLTLPNSYQPEKKDAIATNYFDINEIHYYKPFFKEQPNLYHIIYIVSHEVTHSLQNERNGLISNDDPITKHILNSKEIDYKNIIPYIKDITEREADTVARACYDKLAQMFLKKQFLKKR